VDRGRVGGLARRGPGVEGGLYDEVARAELAVEAALAEAAVRQAARQGRQGRFVDRRRRIADRRQSVVDEQGVDGPGEVLRVEAERVGGGRQRGLVGAAVVAVDVDVGRGELGQRAELGDQRGLVEHDRAGE